MKRTYIQVKKLHNLLGDMTHVKVEVHVYKRMGLQLNDCIFTETMHAKDISLAFGEYWVYAIMPTIVNESRAIKLLICIERPDGEWQEI